MTSHSGSYRPGRPARRSRAGLIFWTLMVAAALSAGSCAGGRRVSPGPSPSGQPLPGSDRVYPSQDPRNQAAPGAPEAFPNPDSPSGGTPGRTYQVQVFATSSRETARLKALEIAESLAAPVRLDQEGGLYLVRAGGTEDRDEALRLLRQAVDLGYTDAFLVPPGR